MAAINSDIIRDFCYTFQVKRMRKQRSNLVVEQMQGDKLENLKTFKATVFVYLYWSFVNNKFIYEGEVRVLNFF